MEIEYYEKVNLIEKAIKEKKLILQIENVNNGKIKKVNYDIFCEKYHNKFFDYLFYVNGDFFDCVYSYSVTNSLLEYILENQKGKN